MAKNVVIDTSLVINHLRNTSDDLEILEEQSRVKQFKLFIPYIVVMELFAGQSTVRVSVRKQINQTIHKFGLLGLTMTSATIAGELARKFRQIPDPYDLVIAAIAIEHKARVATHNPKHFKQIPGVKLWRA